MSDKYAFHELEQKWQKRWADDALFVADPAAAANKFYCLTMFPYPSGVLHMGHVINYTLGDIISRYKRLRGHTLVSPMGWDSFGLPAENAAIRTGTHPQPFTDSNIARMRGQMKRAGWGYDWSREVATSHPDYYRWTQWFFLQFYKHGLAEKKTAPVNWCNSCETVLANEQVHDGSCERCGTAVHQKDMSQWFFTMSRYAQRLLDGHAKLRGQWPDAVLAMQEEWIGRSEGARVNFTVAETGDPLPVFTTRPDTLFGVTFMSMAPEHPLVEKLVRGTPRETEVMAAVAQMRQQGTSAKEVAEREKVGIWTGFHVINPVNGDRVPLWVANFALMNYGTGAVMAVPAHDQRDFEFARKYDIPIKVVIERDGDPLEAATLTAAYTAAGAMRNSGPFDGRNNREAMADIIAWLTAQGYGEGTVNYRLRDWLLSRQRYWGAPIPVIYCESCGMVPVPEQDLPVLLPGDVTFREGHGNPLATSEAFVHCACPSCGRPARRETDTMDTFVDSSWYFLRYCDPHNTERPFDPELIRRWMPVDQYIGGIEHATMHLIYARFFTMVLHDLGLVDVEEPFTRLFCQGMVCKMAYYCETHKWLHEDKVVDGRREGDAIIDGKCAHCGVPVRAEMTKISKSKYNVVDPDAMFDRYGADTVRLYMVSDSPPDKMQIWSESGINGAWRFLNRLWDLVLASIPRLGAPGQTLPADLDATNTALRRKAHQCIMRVTEAIEGGFQFNTAIARCNELLTQFRAAGDGLHPAVLRESLETVLRVLSPIVPHFAEELWSRMGHAGSLFSEGWPVADAEVARDVELVVPVQINGKVRIRLTVSPSISSADLEATAMQHPEVAAWIAGKTVRKVVVVPGKLVNIAVS
ncbi:MAG TPA: leucine--tRNA ligase [Verrucomicrobia bacterium]|nr:leucine--tRNA ligase [Verrucomicrobiota bacterium]